MLIDYTLGQAGVVLRVKLRNTSVSYGSGLTGLTNASTGLIIATIADNEAASTAYTAAGSTIDGITTLGTFATPTAGHCRFKEVDAANHKGIYEIQVDNARFAVQGAKSLIVSLSGAANMAECDVTIPLRAVNPYDAQRFGLGALPASGTLAVNPTLAATQSFNNAGQTSNLPTDLQTIKGQSVTAAAGVTFPASIGTSTYAGGAVTSVTSPVTLASTQSFNNSGQTTNLPTDLQTIKGQAVTAAAGVTFPATISSYAGGAVASVTAPVTVNAINGLAPPAGWNTLSIAGSKVAATVAAGDGADAASLKATVGVAGAGLTAIPYTGPSAATIVTTMDGTSAMLAAILNAANNVTSNTARTVAALPDQMPIPLSGSTSFEVDLLLFNLQGTNEAPDAPPTVHARNASGTSRDDHLSSTTMSQIGAAVGRYQVAYTVPSTDPSEEVFLDFTVTVGGVARTVTYSSQTAPAFASTFNSTDRSTLNSIATTVSGTVSATIPAPPSWYVAPDNTDVVAVLASVGSGLKSELDAVKATIGVAGAGLTALGDTRLANLDATVSSRLAASSYVAPDNSDIASIKATLGVAGAGLTALGDARLANLDAAVSSRLATTAYTAPDNADAAATLALLAGLVASGDHAQFTAHALANAPTAAGVSAAAIAAAVLTDTTAGDLAQAGSLGYLVGHAPAWYVAPDNADIAAVKATIGTAGAGLTALGDGRLANLDAAVSTRSTYAGGAVASVTAPVTVGTVQDKAGYALAPAGLDPVAVEAGLNARQALALAAAGDAGQVTYASGGTAVTITGAGVSTPRITATVDASGNRVPTIHPPA